MSSGSAGVRRKMPMIRENHIRTMKAPPRTVAIAIWMMKLPLPGSM